MIYDYNKFFKKFVSEMDSAIKVNEEEIGRTTKQLMNDLFKVERSFKKLLLSTPEGEKSYEDFMEYILEHEDKGNMLSARVYFRERQGTFSKKMYKAFHEKNSKKLYQFRINYQFCHLIMRFYKGPNKKSLLAHIEQMKSLRETVCENNLPLAINRAKMFWSKPQKSHVDYMDIIQASSEGLLEAIDKFAPPYKQVFVGTLIGRMTLNMSDTASQTLIKLPPQEKRILYRVNKAKRANPNISEQELTEFVKQSFPSASSELIAKIISAGTQSKIANIDEKKDDQYSMAETLQDQSMGTEEKVEVSELYSKMLVGMSMLTLVEKKIILMKFGDINI